MDETPAEIAALQELMDASFDRASEHLRSIMTPDRRVRAEDLVRQLTGIAVLDLATVTASGEPRISAVDGHFLHGRWAFTTAGGAVKVRHIAHRPAVSAAYTPRDGYGVFCHGRARRLQPGGAEWTELEQHCVRTYGQSPQEWGPDIAYFCIEPTWFVGYAMEPDAA